METDSFHLPHRPDSECRRTGSDVADEFHETRRRIKIRQNESRNNQTSIIAGLNQVQRKTCARRKCSSDRQSEHSKTCAAHMSSFQGRLVRPADCKIGLGQLCRHDFGRCPAHKYFDIRPIFPSPRQNEPLNGMNRWAAALPSRLN